MAIADIHEDIIKTHILTRLDGQTLAAAGCASSQLQSLCSDQKLWSDICSYNWPSTVDPLVSQAISNFPSGYRSFYSDSSSSPTYRLSTTTSLPATSHIISSVDLRYHDELIFSTVESTNTTPSDWFQSSPFRIDLLELKELIPSSIKFSGDNQMLLSNLEKHMTLSWIMIDPTQNRAVNLSSIKPVSVRRNWLTGNIEITCGVKEGGGELNVSGASLMVLDMDGKCLSGKEIVADNKISKVGIYEIDDDWKPFSTHNYDNNIESDGEDDEDAIADIMIVGEENKFDDMSDTLEEGEIELDLESRRVPESQFEVNDHEATVVESPVEAPADVPGGVGVEAIIIDGSQENLNGELGRNKEDQQSQFNGTTQMRIDTIEDGCMVDNVEHGNPLMSLGKIREQLRKGGIGPFPNSDPRMNNEPNNVSNLEMDPNGSYLKRKKVHQASLNINNIHLCPTHIDDQTNQEVIGSESGNHSSLDLNRTPNNVSHPSQSNRPPTIPHISEIEKTVEIGRLIGFEINGDNEILAEITGMDGEHVADQ
ncbi:unnamed protein product [Lactuca saligna]|uniref:F-box domain-containing protein n=1 Tax=Lactuca saligna TaxID=75948 RepID=A0AA35VK82_LACSI|nr:unnamed protein product [Lactuca saligna]